MNKRRLQNFICYTLLCAWSIFCIQELPKLQEQQRLKVKMQEQQCLTEIQTSIHTTGNVYVSLNDIKQHTEPIIEVQTITPEKEFPKYTDPDLILLAQLIEAEGGIENYQCKLYIGSVVLNRMMHNAFPDCLRDVIFQVSDNGVHQFSVTRTRNDGTRAIDCEPSNESLKAAAELLTYGTKLPMDVVVFYSKHCEGSWVTSRKTYTQEDNTIFAYAYSK